MAGAKVNFNKGENPQLRACWDPSASLGCGFGHTSNWNKISRKYSQR